jgi:glycosyltransferase involved in cell wall biosynthesis
MPRISVVIPSFNHERFIGDAIRSVAAQQCPDLELIVIDDGSTDGSPDQIRKELDACSFLPSAFVEQENRGTHAAIERGVLESSGEIIAILNSDDRYAQKRFEHMAPYFKGQEDFLAFSKVRLIGASGAELLDSHPTSAGYRHALYEATRCPTIGFGLLRNNFAVTSGNLIFSRSLYERLGGFADYQLAHDWDFLLRALVCVEPIFVPEVLLDYRIHQSNTIHRVAGLADKEGRKILNDYLALCSQGTENPLAACPQNWPLYFDLFTSRHAPWFGPMAIREWIDNVDLPTRTEDGQTRWLSWAQAVDFERVDDCGYIVSPGSNTASLDALAIARDALVSEAHPLALEFGDGRDALRLLFERHAHPMAQFESTPWKSPISGNERGPDYDVPPPANARPQGQPSGWIRAGKRLGRAGLNQLLRAITLGSQSESIGRIAHSGIFDADYYRIISRAQSGLRSSQLIRHYMETGAALKLDPHPLFDTSFYLESYPDVDREGINPLWHYLAHGAAEGRDPHPLFGSRFYLDSNPDVAESGINPLSHYIRDGAFEGRDPHPRFDSEFYQQHCTKPIPEEMTPLAHYILIGETLNVPINREAELRAKLNLMDDSAIQARRTLEQGPLRSVLHRLRFSGFFDADYYAQHVHNDLESADSFRHFIEVGSLEGLPFCRPKALGEGMRRMARKGALRPELAYLRDTQPAAQSADRWCVEIYVSSLGAGLYREMASILRNGFAEAGARVRLLDENQEPGGLATHRLIVAPHEFFTRGRGPERFAETFLAGAHILMAEAPDSRHFSTGVWFAQRARGVIEINPISAFVWGEIGFRSRFLPLAPDSSGISDKPDLRDAILVGALGSEATNPPPRLDAPLAERPIDIFFDRTLSPRRRRFFAEVAPLLASLRCALFMPAPDPHEPSELSSALNASEAAAIAQRSKIHLALHRDETPDFDWYRNIVRGMLHKTLLLTEEGPPIPGLIAGKDYIERPISKIPQTLEWLLHDADGRAEAESVRNHGFEALRSQYSPMKVLSRILHDSATDPNAFIVSPNSEFVG